MSMWAGLTAIVPNLRRLAEQNRSLLLEWWSTWWTSENAYDLRIKVDRRTVQLHARTMHGLLSPRKSA
jgi:hypothetical protein